LQIAGVEYLPQRFAFLVVIITFLDTIPKTFQGPGLIWMSAVDEDAGRLAFQTETKINVATEAIWDILEAILIELVIDLWIGMLEHVFLALKNTEHRAPKSTWTICHYCHLPSYFPTAL
jgi:hypothetical protein